MHVFRALLVADQPYTYWFRDDASVCTAQQTEAEEREVAAVLDLAPGDLVGVWDGLAEADLRGGGQEQWNAVTVGRPPDRLLVHLAGGGMLALDRVNLGPATAAPEGQGREPQERQVRQRRQERVPEQRPGAGEGEPGSEPEPGIPEAGSGGKPQPQVYSYSRVLDDATVAVAAALADDGVPLYRVALRLANTRGSNRGLPPSEATVRLAVSRWRAARASGAHASGVAEDSPASAAPPPA